MSNTNELKLLSFSEAAKRLGIGKDSLHQLINNGQIGIISIGKRIKIAQIELTNYITNATIRLTPEYETNSTNTLEYSSSTTASFDSVDFFNKLKGEL